jgi:anti-sigma B factor antagonist
MFGIGSIGQAGGVAEDQLEITSEVLDTAVVVTVVGEVDNSNADQLQRVVGAALDRAGPPHQAGAVAVDLTRVSFFGSAGLQALVQSADLAREGCKPLRIVVNEHRPVLLPIQLTGLDQLLALYDSLADALRFEL